jgi:ABC-2 type transport system permease protein
MSSTMRAAAAAFLAQVKNALVSHAFWFTLGLQPVIFTTLAYLSLHFTGREELLGRSVIGAGLVGLWNCSLWSTGYVVESERREGTLELAFVAPVPLLVQVFSKVLADACLAGGALVVALLWSWLALGFLPHIAAPVLFGATAAMTVIAVSCLGLLIANAFVLSRAAGRLAEVCNYPVYILSGLMFPLSILPAWTRPLSYILAPTWAMAGLEAAAAGDARGVAVALAAQAGLAALYLLVARALYASVHARVRRAGSLGVF